MIAKPPVARYRLPMITERIPQIKSLSIQEKKLLMNELWEEIRQSGEEEPDPAVIALLQSRWDHYLANPDSAITLEEFRKRLGRS